jgi:LPXTG-motif cell wall-anchored protein
LPATGAHHTLGLVMVAGGLIGLGAWFSAYAKRREVK